MTRILIAKDLSSLAIINPKYLGNPPLSISTSGGIFYVKADLQSPVVEVFNPEDETEAYYLVVPKDLLRRRLKTIAPSCIVKIAQKIEVTNVN